MQCSMFVYSVFHGFVPEVANRSAVQIALVDEHVVPFGTTAVEAAELRSLVKRRSRFELLCFSFVQVLTNKEKVFLRIANDRGWTYAKNPGDDSTLFEEISGDIAEDK